MDRNELDSTGTATEKGHPADQGLDHAPTETGPQREKHPGRVHVRKGKAMGSAKSPDRTKEAAQDISQFLSLAVRAGNLGIWDRNVLEGTETWNDQMYEIYGQERTTCPSSYSHWRTNIVHPDDQTAVDAAIHSALKGTAAYDFEFRVVHPGGAIRHIRTTAKVVRDAHGHPLRIIGVSRDRTLEVAEETQESRLRTKLLHAERIESIGALAGGVAHDMNNVLCAIMGISSTLRTTCSSDDDPLAAPLDTITRACARGRDVVKSLLYFARKDQGVTGPVDLNLIAREVVQLLSYTTLSRIQTHTDLQEPLGLLQGDAGALGHALLNLCVNSVDAMPEGGTLTIRTHQVDDRIRVSIKDTGQGMLPEVARRATEPFFTTKPQSKGTGLGLPMVHSTAKAHRGTLEIRSAPGRGTEVILTFPLRPTPTAKDRALDANTSPHASLSKAKWQILLVDDDELVRGSVAQLLQTLGHEVTTTDSGEQALERFHQGLTSDLVILDMNMPGLNGAQTMEGLLSINPKQLLLLVTGYTDDLVTPLQEGKHNVFSLRKPFSINELAGMLASITSRYSAGA